MEEILGGGTAFPNRTLKKHTTDKVKTTLPASPAKKAAVLESLVSSPSTRKQLEKRGAVTTPEEQRKVAHECPLTKPDMFDESIGGKEAYS